MYKTLRWRFRYFESVLTTSMSKKGKEPGKSLEVRFDFGPRPGFGKQLFGSSREVTELGWTCFKQFLYQERVQNPAGSRLTKSWTWVAPTFGTNIAVLKLQGSFLQRG